MAKSNSQKKKARRHHRKTCEGKQPYPNKKSAERAATTLREEKNWRHITAYECQECAQWHLGNRR